MGKTNHGFRDIILNEYNLRGMAATWIVWAQQDVLRDTKARKRGATRRGQTRSITHASGEATKNENPRTQVQLSFPLILLALPISASLGKQKQQNELCEMRRWIKKIKGTF